MTKTEIKSRVEFRMKPLMLPGVRIIFGKSEFAIQDYDFFDSSNSFIINVSDRKEPLECNLNDIRIFLDSAKRKDGTPIPAFDQDVSSLETKPSHELPRKEKPVAAPVKAMDLDDEDEEDEYIPEVVELDEAEPVSAPAVIRPASKGKFVHIASTVQVYVTRDYSLFSILQGNRSLNKGKIKRIKDEIEAGTNLLQYCPVIVMEYEGKLKVIDGQHRLEVAKQLLSNVWYVVIPAAITLYEIAKMNSNTEKWSKKDFINCYVQAGNSNYSILKEFTDTYQFPLSSNLQLLATGMKTSATGDKNLMQQFHQGQFVVRSEDEALTVAKEVCKFSDFPGYKAGAFISAICKIMTAGNVPIDEVAKAYAMHKDDLTLQSTDKGYLLNLEAIVNKGKSKRRILY